MPDDELESVMSGSGATPEESLNAIGIGRRGSAWSLREPSNSNSSWTQVRNFTPMLQNDRKRSGMEVDVRIFSA